MKKSTHIPDPATPDQAPERSLGAKVEIPTTPVRIFTFDERSFLHLHGNDHVVSITSDISDLLFVFWMIEPAGRDGYTIQCFPFDLYLAVGSLGELIVTSKSMPFDVGWEFEKSRPDYVYIRRTAANSKVLTLSSFSENSPVLVADKSGGLANEKQMFRLGHKFSGA